MKRVREKPSATDAAGAQSILRSIQLLRALGRRPTAGLRLSEAAEQTRFHKATAHRILGALERQGFVERVAETGAYRLGPEVALLGLAAEVRLAPAPEILDILREVARETADTVFLAVRHGNEATYLARELGSYPIKVLEVEVGSRRPLGIGAACLALMAFQPENEWDAIGNANAHAYRSFGLDTERVLELCRQSRELGYALNDRAVLPEMTGIGAPIRSRDGDPVLAISVAAISQRMKDSRRKWIARLLADAAEQIGRIYRLG